MPYQPDGTWYQYGLPIDEAILEQAKAGNAEWFFYLQSENGQIMDRAMYTFPFKPEVCEAIEDKYPDIKLVNVRKQGELYPQNLEDYLEAQEGR